MTLVKSCENDIHKVIAEPKQPTQVPKRNNRNSFTARVGRKKKKDNNNNKNNKLNFEDDDEDNNDHLNPNRVRNENDFIEFNRSNRPIDNDNKSDMSKVNANSNIANIDQITDLQQSIHNTRRSRQQSINLIGLDDDGLLENFINMNSQEYKSEMTKLSHRNYEFGFQNQNLDANANDYNQNNEQDFIN